MWAVHWTIYKTYIFSNNARSDKSDKGYIVTQLITHFNESISPCASNHATQGGKVSRMIGNETIS